MKVLKTELAGCVILEPEIFQDRRGHFFESYNQKSLERIIGKPISFVQDNQSFSKKGVIRALHFQKGKHAQAKLVRVIQGKVLDVAVDIRQESPTYGQHIAIELSADNRRQLFIPRGFAHGFSVLSDIAIFAYKCDNYYHPDAEEGILFKDPILDIDWKVPYGQMILSERDKELPYFKPLGI